MNVKPTMSTAVVSLAAVLAATVVGAGVAIIHLESDATQLNHEVSAESVALHHLQGEISSRSNGGLAQTVTRSLFGNSPVTRRTQGGKPRRGGRRAVAAP